MTLFCTTNFPVLRRTRPGECHKAFIPLIHATCIVTQERCVFRKIFSNKTAYSQNCVSPDYKEEKD